MEKNSRMDWGFLFGWIAIFVFIGAIGYFVDYKLIICRFIPWILSFNLAKETAVILAVMLLIFLICKRVFIGESYGGDDNG